MKLTEAKENQTIFIDANIFIYHFSGVSGECKEFLKNCIQRRFKAVTATTILAEVCHRLMTIEAVALKFIEPKQPSNKLAKNPAVVKRLSQYYTQMTNILSWGIEIITPSADIIIRSQIYRQRYGLLTNDSFIPVYMEQTGTTFLASADQIFHSIPHLRLYSPSDIQ